MEVVKSEARELLISMGFDEDAVNGWTNEKLETKLNALDEKYKKGKNDPDNKDSKKLLKSILSAIEDDETIELAAEKKSKKTDKKGKKGKSKKKDEDDEEEEDDEPKSKKKGKKSKAPNRTFGKAGKVGITETIYNEIIKTTKEKPITKEKMLDILEKKFPDRERDSMAVTVYSQLAYKFPTERGWPVKKTGGPEGKFFWSGKVPKTSPFAKKGSKSKDEDDEKPKKKKK